MSAHNPMVPQLVQPARVQERQRQLVHQQNLVQQQQLAHQQQLVQQQRRQQPQQTQMQQLQLQQQQQLQQQHQLQQQQLAAHQLQQQRQLEQQQLQQHLQMQQQMQQQQSTIPPQQQHQLRQQQEQHQLQQQQQQQQQHMMSTVITPSGSAPPQIFPSEDGKNSGRCPKCDAGQRRKCIQLVTCTNIRAIRSNCRSMALQKNKNTAAPQRTIIEDGTLVEPHRFFDHHKYVFIKEIEMKVADGRWRTAQIFGRKELPTTVVIFFGGNEYEGLDGCCKMDPLTGHIFDADGRMIEARPLQGDFGASDATTPAGAVAAVQRMAHQQKVVPIRPLQPSSHVKMLSPEEDKFSEKRHLIELQEALNGVMESRFCVGGEWLLDQPIIINCHKPKSVAHGDADSTAATPEMNQALQFPMTINDSKQLDVNPFIKSLCTTPDSMPTGSLEKILPASCFDVNIELDTSSSPMQPASERPDTGFSYTHFSSTILQRVHTSLVPEAQYLRAELQHLSWRTSGFKQTTFSQQPRGANQSKPSDSDSMFVGVLELLFPCPFRGGALRIRHEQHEKQFLYPAYDPAQSKTMMTSMEHFTPRNCIAWTAFFGDACFCVSPIPGDQGAHYTGSRVSLIYFLYREGLELQDIGVDHLLLRVHMLQEQIRQALRSRHFFPQGGRLHFRMRHLYDERSIAVTQEKLRHNHREHNGPVSIQGNRMAGVRLRNEDAVAAVVFSAFHLDVTISRLLEMEVDEQSRLQHRLTNKEKGEPYHDPVDNDILWILRRMPSSSKQGKGSRKSNSTEISKEEQRKMFGRLRRTAGGGYSLMSVTREEVKAFAHHEIKRSEHTWIGTYAIPHRWFADRAYGPVVEVATTSDVNPSCQIEVITEDAVEASFLTSCSFCVHVPPAEERMQKLNLGIPPLSASMVRRKKPRKKKKKGHELVHDNPLKMNAQRMPAKRSRLTPISASSIPKPSVRASAVRAPSISSTTVPAVDPNFRTADETFPLESLAAEAAKHAKAFPKASKTTSLPTGVFSSSHHGVKLTENMAPRFCVRISIGGKQFRLGTTYADVESARKMYLVARRVLVRVGTGRLALNEERLEKELSSITIRVYRTKNDTAPTTVFMKDYLRDWISSQQPLSRRRRTRKRPLVQRAVSNPVSAQTQPPQQVQTQPISEQQQQQQHYQAIQMQQQAHTAAILAARANAHQLPAAMVISQHQQPTMPVPIQVPLPVSTIPAAEMASAMKQKNISMEV